MQAYKFASTATATKPDNDITRLLEKAIRKEKLSREEKDRIANILYGLFSGYGATYRLAGWAWYMADCLPRILVSNTWSPQQFDAYYAPDKTSLRKALRGLLPVNEMIYADRRR